MRIGILIYDEVEVLDACGPFEVFSTAARLQERGGRDKLIHVTLISAHADRNSVVARGGLRLVADENIAGFPAADAPDLDMLLVPGGVTTEIERDLSVLAWLSAMSATPRIASVCTGAFLLAEAGILRGGRATTHWEDQSELARRFPALTVVDGPRWVQQGSIYTSAGISAGIDLALHLTGLIDPDLPQQVACQMDYVWNAENSLAEN